jgi:hypothetical protein
MNIFFIIFFYKKNSILYNTRIIQDAVAIWEKARPAKISTELRTTMVKDIIHLIKGKMVEISRNHSAARIIQFVLKYCSDIDRKKIFAEFNKNLLILAKCHYGFYVAKKVIRYLDKKQLIFVHCQFFGHVCKMLRHPFGNIVLDSLYHASSPPFRSAIIAEFYGLKISQFNKSKHLNLGVLLKHFPSKKDFFLTNIANKLSIILEKRLVQSAIVHRVLAEYLNHASNSAILNASLILSKPILINVLNSEDGIWSINSILKLLNRESKTQSFKELEGHVFNIAGTRSGHITILNFLILKSDNFLNNTVICEILKDFQKNLNSYWSIQLFLKLCNPVKKILESKSFNQTYMKYHLERNQLSHKKKNSSNNSNVLSCMTTKKIVNSSILVNKLSCEIKSDLNKIKHSPDDNEFCEKQLLNICIKFSDEIFRLKNGIFVVYLASIRCKPYYMNRRKDYIYLNTLKREIFERIKQGHYSQTLKNYGSRAFRLLISNSLPMNRPKSSYCKGIIYELLKKLNIKKIKKKRQYLIKNLVSSCSYNRFI